jgi:hypothetical protein
VGSHVEGETYFLDSAGAYGFEAVSQAIRIHSRGGTDRLKIFFVVKKELLRLAAKTQRPANPFFQSFCDHGAPKSLLRCSPILNLQKGTFKHALGPQCEIIIG